VQDQLQHPTALELAAFSSGLVDEERLARLQGHIAQCPCCRAVLKSLPPDRLEMLLRESLSCSEPLQVLALSAGPEELPPFLVNHLRYRVLGKIGAGGMGTVFKAEHRLMKRMVALKVINPKLMARPDAAVRFRREVEAVAKLGHPNIAAAYDAEQADERHFLVMEFVEGTDLARLVAERGPLPVPEACEYIRQTALGLQHAHERGMVHRDIKPQNLMRTPDGRIKILDFGLAALVTEAEREVCSHTDETPALNDALTDFGEGMGTPDYSSPEQLRDAHVLDARSDLYSLGCTLYFLLAGGAPFAAESRTQKVVGHLVLRPRPLAEFQQNVSEELTRVLDRLLAKNPAERFQTAGAVAQAVAPFARKEAGMRSGPRRKRWLLAGAGLILLGCLTWFAIIFAAKPQTTGCLLFSCPTDTVQVNGGTVLDGACTYEVRILFTNLYGYPGSVFNEWTKGKEDKYFAMGPGTGVGATSYPACRDISAPVSPSDNAWHHVAYAYDGTEARLYMDGKRVAARPASGKIGNGDGRAFLGAIFRPPDEKPRRSFLGYLDTLRISDIARYSGEGFPPPSGDLPSDEHTVLLFNFNEPEGSTSIRDESGSGLTGLLGGPGATPPKLVVDPLLARHGENR